MNPFRRSNEPHTAMHDVHIIAQLADLKDRQYHESLTITALIELLIEKQLITPMELQNKMIELDTAFTPHPKLPIS